MARGLGRALALALAGTAMTCAAADAATVGVTDGRFAYTAGDGETNRVGVTRIDAGFLVDDLTTDADGALVPLELGSGCVPLVQYEALCQAADGYARLDGGDGADALAAINDLGPDQRYELIGGDGADTLTATSGLDILAGGSGDDTLRGGAGDDVLKGGTGGDELAGDGGDDRLEGGEGADFLDGGAGTDTASWWQETSPVTVTLDNVRNDGTGGEDHAYDVEEVEGGDAADTLVAGGGPAFLEGNGGGDTLVGSPAADSLLGGDGDDTLDAGAGDDLVFAQAGADAASGGDGADRLYGDQGADALDGGAGDDRLEGSGGDDRLVGGDGSDLLLPGFGVDWMDGGGGADAFRGDGEGPDTVSYATRTAPVSVTLSVLPSLIADDGEAGEGDDLSGVEGLVGGSGPDDLTGSAAAERIDGGAGADSLDGAGGDDHMVAVDRTRDAVGCGAGTDAADVDPRDKTAGCEVIQKLS